MVQDEFFAESHTYGKKGILHRFVKMSDEWNYQSSCGLIWSEVQGNWLPNKRAKEPTCSKCINAESRAVQQSEKE